VTIPFAYIDPGAGAILWQSIVAVFAGSLFFVRRLLRRTRKGQDRKDK
jgi:hypothetical protein